MNIDESVRLKVTQQGGTNKYYYPIPRKQGSNCCSYMYLAVELKLKMIMAKIFIFLLLKLLFIER